MPDQFNDHAWVSDLAVVCDEIAAGADELTILRQLHALLLRAPAAVRSELGIAADEAVEDLLATKACSEVALRLLGGASYMMSRGSAGSVKATVVSGHVIHESVAEGRSEAQAICTALAGGLMEWSQRVGMLKPPGSRAH